eukprot:snap_masked-scaffold_15-processed-gene-10.24-mRNA-1 protein AED:1.00 eAED:1.00 QI:0/-1/0/0/-1/1/1/0/467
MSNHTPILNDQDPFEVVDSLEAKNENSEGIELESLGSKGSKGSIISQVSAIIRQLPQEIKNTAVKLVENGAELKKALNFRESKRRKPERKLPRFDKNTTLAERLAAMQQDKHFEQLQTKKSQTSEKFFSIFGKRKKLVSTHGKSAKHSSSFSSDEDSYLGSEQSSLLESDEEDLAELERIEKEVDDEYKTDVHKRQTMLTHANAENYFGGFTRKRFCEIWGKLSELQGLTNQVVYGEVELEKLQVFKNNALNRKILRIFPVYKSSAPLLNVDLYNKRLNKVRKKRGKIKHTTISRRISFNKMPLRSKSEEQSVVQSLSTMRKMKKGKRFTKFFTFGSKKKGNAMQNLLMKKLQNLSAFEANDTKQFSSAAFISSMNSVDEKTISKEIMFQRVFALRWQGLKIFFYCNDFYEQNLHKEMRLSIKNIRDTRAILLNGSPSVTLKAHRILLSILLGFIKQTKKSKTRIAS